MKKNKKKYKNKLAEVLKRYDFHQLSDTEIDILVYMLFKDNKVNSDEIEREIGISQSTASKSLNDLLEQGYIKEQEHETDHGRPKKEYGTDDDTYGHILDELAEQLRQDRYSARLIGEIVVVLHFDNYDIPLLEKKESMD